MGSVVWFNYIYTQPDTKPGNILGFMLTYHCINISQLKEYHYFHCNKCIIFGPHLVILTPSTYIMYRINTYIFDLQ